MGQMLRSWKEIACHLGASVRTVQRWEREFRLPVRRLQAKRGAVVFAFTAELETWMRARSRIQVPLVEDSYFRTVFMDSQFPSLVVDDVPRILAANFAASDLVGAAGPQLLGQKLEQLLCAGDGRTGDHWADFLKSGACFGQANLQRADSQQVGVEFVSKRFPPGLHVVSILSVHKPWPAERVWCRPVEADFAFHVRPDSSPGLRSSRRNNAPLSAS